MGWFWYLLVLNGVIVGMCADPRNALGYLLLGGIVVGVTEFIRQMP